MGGATESRCVRTAVGDREPAPPGGGPGTADVTVNRSEPVRLTVTSAIETP
jgi:hypothetical protein